MANNRMYLKCKVCDKEFAFAKYYPETSWYTVREDNKALNEWLDGHRHNDTSMYGAYQFEMVYEIPGEFYEDNMEFYKKEELWKK